MATIATVPATATNLPMRTPSTSLVCCCPASWLAPELKKHMNIRSSHITWLPLLPKGFSNLSSTAHVFFSSLWTSLSWAWSAPFHSALNSSKAHLAERIWPPNSMAANASKFISQESFAKAWIAIWDPLAYHIQRNINFPLPPGKQKYRRTSDTSGVIFTVHWGGRGIRSQRFSFRRSSASVRVWGSLWC